jgi:hypothetical protein
VELQDLVVRSDKSGNIMPGILEFTIVLGFYFGFL